MESTHSTSYHLFQLRAFRQAQSFINFSGKPATINSVFIILLLIPADKSDSWIGITASI